MHMAAVAAVVVVVVSIHRRGMVRLVMVVVVVVRRIRVVLGGVRPYFGSGVGRRCRTVQVMRAHPSPLARLVQVQVQATTADAADAARYLGRRRCVPVRRR